MRWPRRHASCIAKVKVISARIIEIDRALDQTQSKQSNVEIQIALRIAGDGGNVMKPGDFLIHWHHTDLVDFNSRKLATGRVRPTGGLSESIFRKGIVGVAIQPALARLRRRNYGMPALLRVLAGMAVRRTIATQGDAAFLAGPQMHPVRADLHAFFAFAALRLFD